MAAVVQLKTMFKEFMDPTTDTAPEVLSRLLTHWGQISEVHWDARIMKKLVRTRLFIRIRDLNLDREQAAAERRAKRKLQHHANICKRVKTLP